MTTKEIWKVIPSHQNYEASNLGRIRRSVPSKCSEAGQLLKPFYAGMGKRRRYSFKSWDEGSSKTVRVHVAVCEAFKGLRPEGLVCCHNDGDWTNNNLTNLRWGTRKSNSQDQISHGTRPTGEAHVKSKLTWEKVAGIRAARRGTNMTLAQIGAVYGVTGANIRAIVTNETWKTKFHPDNYTFNL